MYGKILVATDGSEPGARAVDLASDLAKVHDAKLTVVHVINPSHEAPDWLHYSYAQALGFVVPPMATARGDVDGRKREQERTYDPTQILANRLIQDSGNAAKKRGAKNVRTILEQGAAAKRILVTAKRENADVIVIGSRGHGNLRGLLSGSVSSEVAKDAECPCISVT